MSAANDRLVISISKRVVARGVVVGVAAALLVALGYVAGVRAAVPSDVGVVYSGTIVDNGAPLTGTHAIAVSLFADATTTSVLCNIAQDQSAALTQGRFSIALDSTCAAKLHLATSDVFVEMQVDGHTIGTRNPINAVPFALEATHATTADSAANVTAWQTYDAHVFVGGVDISASVTTEASFRRVGDSIDLRIRSRFQSAPPNTSRIIWTLPPGLTIDATSLPSVTTPVAGAGDAGNASNVIVPAYAFMSLDTTPQGVSIESLSTGASITQGNFDFTNAGVAELLATVPVTP